MMLQQEMQGATFIRKEPREEPHTQRSRVDYTGHVARGLWFMAAVLLIGSLVDLGVLWGLQRQNQPQWEFVAISNTLDAFPRFVLAMAGAYLALFVTKSTSLFAFRVMAVFAVMLGLASAALGALLITDYFALAKLAAAQTPILVALKSAMVKGGALSLFFTLASLGIGIFGWRRPRS